jgi:hypothetical protein
MATRADKYRAKAAECERLAHQARNEIMKRVYEDGARSWMRLATFLDDTADHRLPHVREELRGDHRASGLR